MKRLTYDEFKTIAQNYSAAIQRKEITLEAVAYHLLAFLGRVNEEDLGMAVGYAQGVTKAF